MDALKGRRLWPVLELTLLLLFVQYQLLPSDRRFRVPEAQLNMTLFHSSRSKVVRIEFRFQIEFSVPEVQYGTARGERRDFL